MIECFSAVCRLLADSFRVTDVDVGYEEMMQMCREAAEAAKRGK